MNKWKAEKIDQDVVEYVVGNYHPELVDILHEIQIVFKEKAGKTGGKFNLGKILKAPGILTVLGDKEYQFILEIGYDLWNTLDQKHQIALVDHLLCHIVAEENDQNGEMTYSMRTPDVSYFSEEIDRNGNWKSEVYGLLEEDQKKKDEDKKAKKGKQTSLIEDTDD
jgi:hypothetical protein